MIAVGCLFLLMAGIFPRLGAIIYWIARPERVDAAFDTVLLPILGIIFLPLTTLVYLLLYTPGVGVAGAEWIWVVLAALFDVGHAAAGARRRSYAST
jgi:hypothetical protein